MIFSEEQTNVEEEFKAKEQTNVEEPNVEEQTNVEEEQKLNIEEPNVEEKEEEHVEEPNAEEKKEEFKVEEEFKAKEEPNVEEPKVEDEQKLNVEEPKVEDEQKLNIEEPNVEEKEEELKIEEEHVEEKEELKVKEEEQVNFKEVNNKLNIKNDCDTLIFIYTAPKVGSTGLVSSFRIFGYAVIHIHDEIMLEKLIGVKNVSINDIIRYNSQLGKKIYVIDVYRNPIERKISAFFEKISSYHFNNSEENVNYYNVNKVINRFNNIFPHLGNGDHYIDKYDIKDDMPEAFPHNQKYLIVEKNGVTYIKLRLKDSDEWEMILSRIFKNKICVIRDYQSENKKIGDLFKHFVEIYKIPENYLTEIINDSYLNYYYSESEKLEYFNKWNSKKCKDHIPYTVEQFKVYNDISIENCYNDVIQLNHYIDEGCRCQACITKRNIVKQKILTKRYNGEKILHEEAKIELISSRLKQMNNSTQQPALINIKKNARPQMMRYLV